MTYSYVLPEDQIFELFHIRKDTGIPIRRLIYFSVEKLIREYKSGDGFKEKYFNFDKSELKK